MKRLIYIVLITFILTNMFLFQRTNVEKTKLTYLLEYFVTLIEHDIKNKGEIDYVTQLLLSKNKVNYLLEENKSEKIIFSLTSYYFSYFSNDYIEVKNYYLINFE